MIDRRVWPTRRSRGTRRYPVMAFLILVTLWTAHPGVSKDEDGGIDLARVQTYVGEFERPRNTYTSGSLTVAATVVPDAFAYLVAKEYIERRRAGAAHGAAIQEVAKLLKKKKLENRAGLRVILTGRDVHTFHAALAQKTFRLTGKPKKSSAGNEKGFASIPVKIAADPSHLRIANVRLKKYRRLKTGGRREPISSKPTKLRVLENKKSEIHFAFSRKALRATRALRLELRGSAIKHYNGLFTADVIDLNQESNKWAPIDSIEMVLDLPPERTEIPAALRNLVELVKLQL